MSAQARAVLFADVVGSTSLYRSVGDEKAEALVRGALEGVAAAAVEHGGRLIKTIGDCAMCELPTGEAAARTAIDVHRSGRQLAAAGARPVQFRIGFMVGEIVERDGDVFGDAVNIASRLCDMAKAEQVLTTESSASAMAADLRSMVRVFDHTPVKGVAESLTIVQLLWDKRAATQIFVAPSDVIFASVSRLSLGYAGQEIVLTAAELPYTIGREPGCSLIVPSQFASRLHARIEMNRGKFTLVDDSTNGTYVLPEGADADKLVYIRREAFTLLGRGVFALGERPAGDLPHLLTYDVS